MEQPYCPQIGSLYRPPLVDSHLVHKATSPQAFKGLKIAGRKLWRIDSVISTANHNTPTDYWDEGIKDPIPKLQVNTLDKNIKEGLVAVGQITIDYLQGQKFSPKGAD